MREEKSALQSTYQKRCESITFSVSFLCRLLFSVVLFISCFLSFIFFSFVLANVFGVGTWKKHTVCVCSFRVAPEWFHWETINFENNHNQVHHFLHDEPIKPTIFTESFVVVALFFFLLCSYFLPLSFSYLFHFNTTMKMTFCSGFWVNWGWSELRPLPRSRLQRKA